MKRRLTQTLLGRLAESWKLSTRLFSGRDLDQSERLGGKAKCLKHPAFSLQHSANVQRSTLNVKLLTVILLAGIQLLAGMGVARAGTYVNNKAGVSWTDKWSEKYVPVSDTASIYVLTPPTFVVAKNVRNIRTGETATDIVQAIPNDIVEFSISITNTGETVARNIVIHDSMPSRTIYETGSASETTSLDPVDPPETVTFQHAAGGTFDTNDGDTITAIRWEWNAIDGIYGNNKRTVKFRLRVLK